LGLKQLKTGERLNVRHPYQRRSSGQSISEYAMVPGLILVVSFVSMMSLGDHLNRLALKAKEGLERGIETAETIKSTLATSGTSSQQNTVATQDSIMASMVSEDLAGSVMTLGANGTASLLTQQLEALTSNLLQQGDLTDAQHSSLVKLANLGHLTAEVAQKVEEAAKNSRTLADYKAQTTEYRGVVFSMYMLGNQLGLSSGYTVEDVMAGKAITAGRLVLDLYQAWDEVKKNGTLNNPEVKLQVEKLVRNIVTIEEAVSKARMEVWNGKAPPQSLNSSIASQVIDIKSAQICTTGNNTDTGTQCSAN
jgi:polyhydroxyalkanoate synthesis regulator phasin